MCISLHPKNNNNKGWRWGIYFCNELWWIRGSPGRSWASRCWRPVRSVAKSESPDPICSKRASPLDCCSPWCTRSGDPGGCCLCLRCNSGRWRSGCRSPSAAALAAEPSVLQIVPMCSPSWRWNLQREQTVTQNWPCADKSISSRGQLSKYTEQFNIKLQWITLSNFSCNSRNANKKCYQLFLAFHWYHCQFAFFRALF